MIEDIDRAVIQDLYNNLKAEKGASRANHVLTFISGFLGWCETYGYRAENSNPCKYIKREASQGIDYVVLTLEEYKRLFEALNIGIEEEPYCKTAFHVLQLLALTGCRHTEISSLRKDELDLDNKLLRLKKRKSKKAKNAIMKVPLGDPAIALLRQMIPEHPGSPYVFPSPLDPSKPIVDIRKAFQWALKKAGLKHMRIHDLRHSFATAAIDMGEDPYVLRYVLGHSNLKTTEIYTHMRDTRKITTANKIASTIFATA